jgi:hypothetical protein
VLGVEDVEESFDSRSAMGRELWTLGGGLTGVGPDFEGSIHRYDWRTFEESLLVDLTRPDLVCPAENETLPWGGPDGFIHPPRAGSMALLRTDCGCIDCEAQGFYGLGLEDGIVRESLPPGDVKYTHFSQTAEGGAIIVDNDGELITLSPSGEIGSIDHSEDVMRPVHYPVVP